MKKKFQLKYLHVKHLFLEYLWVTASVHEMVKLYLTKEVKPEGDSTEFL